MSKETDKQKTDADKIEEIATQLLLKGFAEGHNQEGSIELCWKYAEAFINARPAAVATDVIDPDVEQVISVLIEALLQSSINNPNPIRLHDYLYPLKATDNKFRTFILNKIDQLMTIMRGRGLYPRIH